MITRKYLFRSAQLMSTSGELRPGFLQSDASDFEGKAETSKGYRGRKTGPKQKMAKFRFDAKTQRLERTN